MKRVLTYGTFDLLHYGHINILKRAKSLGDYLIVGLSSDEFNELKGKKSVMSYEERKEILEKLTPIFRTAFNDETIELSEDMTTDDFDNWDSVAQMMIVGLIEKEFDIVFKLREVGMLDSVEAFVDGIEGKLA